MIQLSERLRAVTARVEGANPGDAGFLSQLDGARTFFEGIAEAHEIVCDELRPGGAAPSEAEADRYLGEVQGWLGYACFASAYKVRHLLDSLVSGLEDGNYQGAFNSARSLLENSAVLHDLHAQVEPCFVALLSRRASAERLSAIGQSHAALTKFALATRFNWQAAARGNHGAFYDAPEKVDPVLAATNVLTLIKKLPQAQQGDVLWYYGILCDSVHPNGCSHGLAIDGVREAGGSRRRLRLAFRPQSDEALALALHQLAIPVRLSLVFLQGELGELFDCLKKLGERLEQPAEGH